MVILSFLTLVLFSTVLLLLRSSFHGPFDFCRALSVLRSESGSNSFSHQGQGQRYVEQYYLCLCARNTSFVARNGLCHSVLNKVSFFPPPDQPHIRVDDDVPKVENEHTEMGHGAMRKVPPCVHVSQTVKQLNSSVWVSFRVLISTCCGLCWTDKLEEPRSIHHHRGKIAPVRRVLCDEISS